MAQFFLEEYETCKQSIAEDCDRYFSRTVVTAIVAESDTTRAALIAACWFLVKHPEHGQKIRAETETIAIRGSGALSSLSRLNVFINEVIRPIPPAGMTGLARMTGQEGLEFEDINILSLTKVAAPKYVIVRFKFLDVV
jgi:cytochrome P450